MVLLLHVVVDSIDEAKEALLGLKDGLCILHALMSICSTATPITMRRGPEREEWE